LYQRFDIYNMPQGIYNVDFRKMKINFVSDNYDQRDGFELSYYAIDAVDDHNGLDDISVYPNPAANDLHVSFSLAEPSSVRFHLTDLAGKTVGMESFAADAGTNTHTLNVSSLAPGFYILEMSTPMGKSIRKVMVE
ncbi:MAG: T9SS type A sorting domain-containing protein, partial [Bacteroidales bacterium]|nr:T9SS type A sorting domain-containing protein [Bacteroidales bacterium]